MAEAASDAAPIKARWFDGRSSRGREVLVALEASPRGPSLRLHVLDLAHTASRLFSHAEVDWPAQWSADRAPTRLSVALQDHGSVEISDPQAWQQALVRAGAQPTLAQRMQTHWPVLLGVLGAVVLGLLLFYRYGTPWAAAQLTRHIPLQWELELSQQALSQLDGRWLKPSALSAERQAGLKSEFEQLLAQLSTPGIRRYANYTPHYSLLFRRGVGPNAFALPGGSVVLSDEIVELAAKQGLSDDALLGVLAHEIGHVELRHGTRLVVEQGVLNVGLGLALGDVSGVVSTASTLLTTLAYRRQHENESDCFAMQLMTQAQRPTAPMADLLLGLTQPDQHSPARGGAMPGWLSTHPSTPQRAQMLRTGALCTR